MEPQNTKSLEKTGVSALDESAKVDPTETKYIASDPFGLDPEWNHAFQELIRYGDKKNSASRATIVVEEFNKQGLSILNYDLIEEFKIDKDTFEAKLQLFWVRRKVPDVTALVDALRG